MKYFKNFFKSKRDHYIPIEVIYLKRAMDIFLSLLALIIFMPIFPVISILIAITSPGPVIYRQLRIGYSGSDKTEVFWMYKFRTMRHDAEIVTGAIWATQNDPRVTSFGRFLRKTRLDELPQLINVLRGDMSIIGPRPERPGFYKKLETAIPFFAERTWGLKPGITGLAQVSQGYDRDINDVRNKVGFDHAYALQLDSLTSWLRMDIQIILRTFIVMLYGRGQ